MLNLVFKELFKQDSDLEAMPINQDSDKPHLISPDELKDDFEFISDYFSPSNPGSMNLERTRDEDGKKKNRPNLHASIYVLTKKPLHLYQKTERIQRKLRASFGNRSTFQYKGVQVENTVMATQFTGLLWRLDLTGVTEALRPAIPTTTHHPLSSSTMCGYGCYFGHVRCTGTTLHTCCC